MPSNDDFLQNIPRADFSELCLMSGLASRQAYTTIVDHFIDSGKIWCRFITVHRINKWIRNSASLVWSLALKNPPLVSSICMIWISTGLRVLTLYDIQNSMTFHDLFNLKSMTFHDTKRVKPEENLKQTLFLLVLEIDTNTVV